MQTLHLELCRFHSIGLAPQREIEGGHRVQVPKLGAAVVESLVPLVRKRLWNGPCMLGAAEAHTNQMAFCCRGVAVDEAFATMENGEVVDEMHISSLRLDFHLCGPGNSLDGVQSLDLAGGQGRQTFGAGMSLVPKEGRSAKVHDELGVLVEYDRAALEAWPRGSIPSQKLQL